MKNEPKKTGRFGERVQDAEYLAWKGRLRKQLESKSFYQFSENEITGIIADMASVAQIEDMKALEDIASLVDEDILYPALKLMSEGEEPAIIVEVLRTRAETLLHNQKTRYRLVVEGTMGIGSLDDPHIVGFKLESLYVLCPLKLEHNTNPSIDAVREKLQHAAFAHLHFEEITTLICNMAWIARRCGIAALSELIDASDEELINNALRMLIEDQDPGKIWETLEADMSRALQVYEQRYKMILESIFVFHGIEKLETELVTDFHIEDQRLVQLEKELQIAQDLQRGLMPRTGPELDGFEIQGHCSMVEHVGGDFFQYFLTDKETIDICIADVTGHAMQAAIPVVMFSGILKAQMEMGSSVEELFERLNRSLYSALTQRTFICFSMGRLDLATRTFRLANAGCPYPYYFRAENSKVVELMSDAYPLGVTATCSYQPVEIQLERGDYIVFCTDGIMEAVNAQVELFGFERTAETIRKACANKLSATALIDRIIEVVREFAGDTPPRDDMTCVVVHVV